ncbi:hypothetical protein [Thermoanaerobacterium thermosaccharolyticum]|uniref:hypothetical protein n=1 Tax=Thermoanaerobacterium thermosaccharolyticum TaxID=1517 RepID=UPI0020A4DFF7|nr:hypothetical protein [Thermoanaerobacterium thermosaccharolyticum]MCP2239498.1 hypothetical protein [Thermoanaerobacterium thermosaccharolyticum]
MKVLHNIIYPEQFCSTRIYTHPEFEEELKNILEYSGYKEKFIRMYRQRLKFLQEYQNQCYKKKDWFEILKKTDGLYSMKFKGSKNLRIIFKFVGYNKQNIALLLCTFEEKNSKNNSKNSYKEAINIAEKRFDDIRELLD